MRILYIPSSYYLSNPIFLAIAKAAKKHTNIYFDTRDGFNVNCENKDAEDIVNTFNCLLINGNTFSIGIKNIFNFQEHKRKLRAKLKYLNPDVILVTTDMGKYANRVINKWAKENNIPFIIIQPSFLEGSLLSIKNMLRNKLGYLLFNKLLSIPLFRRQKMYGCEKSSNYLFLWGQDFKKMYEGTCIEKNIRLVGNPVFDDLAPRINTSVFKTPVALLCPSMFKGVINKENEVKIQKMYQDIVKQNPQVHFIVKVHPRETEEQYEELLKDCGSNYFITKTANIYELFRLVDVQISLVSYSSFEAIVAGVPVILLGNHMLKFPFDQFNHKAIFSIDSIEEFNWALDICLSKEYIKKFKKLRTDYLSTKLKYLGSSAKHVVKEIEVIVE